MSSKNINKTPGIKTYLLIAMIALVLLSCVISIYFAYNAESNKLLASSEILAVFTVDDHPGVGLDSEKLNFGMITPGSSSTKKITIIPYSADVLVEINMSSNINEFVAVNKNNFTLTANSTEELSFFLINTDNLEYGNYSGFVYINYYSLE